MVPECRDNGRCLSRCCQQYLATPDNVAECDNNGYAKRCKSGFEFSTGEGFTSLCIESIEKAEQCEMEIDYYGNDDKMADGKLKCSSPAQSLCTQRNPIADVPSCKSFCSTSKYFTWKEAAKECYCKNSNARRGQQDGGVSGKTNCHYNEWYGMVYLPQLQWMNLLSIWKWEAACGPGNRGRFLKSLHLALWAIKARCRKTRRTL